MYWKGGGIMNYIEIGKIPPISKNELSAPEQLVENLKSLIGKSFL